MKTVVTDDLEIVNMRQGFEALTGVRPLRGKVLPLSTRENNFRKQEYLVNKGVAEATPKLQKSQTNQILPMQTPRG